METKLTPNARRFLRALVAEGPAYRADLARTLRVSRATVTNLANVLQTEGWIVEPDHEPSALKNLIGTAPQLGTLASVTFLVESYAASLSTLDGRVLGELTVTGNPGTNALDRLDAGAELLESLFAQSNLPTSSLRALHLAVDTQMDELSGEIFAQRASSRWYGVNPKEFFTARFDVPVYLQNTARLEALAEYLAGTCGDHTNMLYVDVSYGVTSGHVVDGIIQSGARGGSGELGHTIYDWNGPLCTCGNTGCLMQYVSIPAMLREYATASGEHIDWPKFLNLAEAGKDLVAMIARRAATVLGRALINVCHTLDPGTIVLSGEVGRGLPSFVDETAAVVRAHTLPLVGRQLTITDGELAGVLTETARAGIHSLRAIEDVVAAAIAI